MKCNLHCQKHLLLSHNAIVNKRNKTFEAYRRDYKWIDPTPRPGLKGLTICFHLALGLRSLLEGMRSTFVHLRFALVGGEVEVQCWHMAIFVVKVATAMDNALTKQNRY